jgi:hypothetical protein
MIGYNGYKCRTNNPSLIGEEKEFYRAGILGKGITCIKDTQDEHIFGTRINRPQN